MTTIQHVIDVPRALPVLARWFAEEWDPYYGLEGRATPSPIYEHPALATCSQSASLLSKGPSPIAHGEESIPSHCHLDP